MFKDNNLTIVMMEIYLHPTKLQSDFARAFSQEVACLASMGLISTLEGPQQYGRKWRITGIGIDKLREMGVL